MSKQDLTSFNGLLTALAGNKLSPKDELKIDMANAITGEAREAALDRANDRVHRNLKRQAKLEAQLKKSGTTLASSDRKIFEQLKEISVLSAKASLPKSLRK